MEKLLLVTFATEATLFFSLLSFAARSNMNAQLLLMLSLLVLCGLCLIVFISLFFKQNKPYRIKMIVALLLAPACLFCAGFWGRQIGDYLFARDLPRLKQAVRLIESGAVPIKKGRLELPEQYRDLAYSVHARRDNLGVLTVTFFVGGGFPVKHQCYLYRANGVLTNAIKEDWPSGFRREKQWFEVHD